MRSTVLISGLIVLAGCSSAPEKPDPTRLERIDPQVSLVEVEQVSLGSGDETGLRPSIVGDQIAAAGGSGEVRLFDQMLAERWTTDLDRPIVGGVGFNGEAVFVVTTDAVLVGLNATDGSERFRVQLPSVSTTPPVADQDLVYVKTQIGRLMAFEQSTGEGLWVEETQESGIGIRGSAPMTLADGALFVLWESGRLVAYQADNGRIAWERQVAVSRGRSPLERIVDSKGAPSVRNEVVATATRNSQVSVLDRNTGQILWSVDTDAYPGALVAFNLVTVVETDGTVSGYQLQTGESVFSTDALKYRELSAPSIVGSSIGVTDLEGIVHLLSPQTGQLVGRVDTGSTKGLVAPVTTPNGVLVQLMDGRLTLLEIRP
jgi:outer membrane protein assembly factor BamB